MNEERNSLPLYTETQTFSCWWLLVAIIPPIVPLIFILNDHSGKSLLLLMLMVIVISGIVPFFLLTGSLKVELRSNSIFFRLTPFTLHWHSVNKNDIVNIYLRKYDPIGEFGGWGVKWGMNGGRKDKCYTTKGNIGIQIELKDDNKILIGTQKPEEWEKIIRETFADSSI